MAITFDRTALYEEVWSTPLKALAKKYGLSDNGLRKVCKALSIPLPWRGYWQKVEAGKRVLRIPLPAGATRSSFVSNPPPPERSGFRTTEDDAWLEERTAFEERQENRIVVDLTPRRWHAAVAPLRDELRQALRELQPHKRDWERAEKNPRLQQHPGWQGGPWRSFLDRGQLLRGTHKRMPMRVTPQTYERALAALNALCREAEHRGLEVSLAHGRGRIVLKGHGGEINVRITEQLAKRSRTERSSWDNKPRRVDYHEPTGKLRLFVGEPWSELETHDEGGLGIEEQLNSAFIRIYRQMVKQRVKEREREAWRRDWNAEEARREAAAAEQRQDEARKQRERRRRSALTEAMASSQAAACAHGALRSALQPDLPIDFAACSSATLGSSPRPACVDESCGPRKELHSVPAWRIP